MSSDSVRRLLEMHPAGLSNHQLLWRLRVAGWHIPAEDLAGNLRELGQSGEIVADRAGRWRIVRRRPVADDGPARPINRLATNPPALLHASPARVVAVSKGPDAPAFSTDEGEQAADWPSLLAYYAATQRQDPRGRVDERIDRHGRSWQLVCPIGAWWGSSEIHLQSGDLPDTFRQAIARRPEGVCSIGYPVSVLRHQGQPAVVPALLLAARYRIDGDSVICAIDEAEPALNPVFPELVARRAGVPQAALIDMLLPEDAAADIEMVAARMRNALATLGGSGLRPGTPDATIPTEELGLRNAVGMFLPTDEVPVLACSGNWRRCASGPTPQCAGPRWAICWPPASWRLATRSRRLAPWS